MCVTDLDLELVETTEDEQPPEPGPQSAGGRAADGRTPGVAWG
jgi:hypothetical protein